MTMADHDSTPGHGKPRCGADARSGEPCRRGAGHGTDHPGVGRCKFHGGSTPSHRQAAQREIAVREVATLGLSREIDPRAALLEEVHRTAGAVDWLRVQVAQLAPEDVVWGTTEAKRSTGKDGDSITQGAAVNVWVQLYQDERRHLVAVSKAAIAAGIEERRVQLAEQQGTLLAGAIRAILGDLNLTAEQQAMVPTVVPARLRELTAQ